jgi:hypothetical protein
VAAVTNGIYASNISFLPVPCSTGNCTYPTIPTLAVCGGCQPLTWTAPAGCLGNWNPDQNSTKCNFTLPDGQHIAVRPPSQTATNVFQMMTTKGTHYNASSTTVRYFVNFEAIGMTFENIGWSNSLISASECALWYCVQAYNISMDSNVLNLTVIDTWNTIEDTSGQDISGNTHYNFTNIPKHFNTNLNSSYYVGENSFLAIQNFLGFSGLAQAGGGYTFSGTYTEAVWNAWGKDGDLGTFIANLARSMTNNMRETSSAAALDMYAGQAFQEKLFIQVRWAWMVLPIVLVVFSVLFLVATMAETRRNQVKAWKSNALALLFLDVVRSGEWTCGGG